MCPHSWVVAQVVQQSDGREGEAYLALWELLQKQDELIAAMLMTSTAAQHVTSWRRGSGTASWPKAMWPWSLQRHRRR
jgi:hypothetical protein